MAKSMQCFGFRRKTQGWFDQVGHTPQPKFQYMINVHAMMFLVARRGPTVGKCPLKS